MHFGMWHNRNNARKSHWEAEKHLNMLHIHASITMIP